MLPHPRPKTAPPSLPEAVDGTALSIPAGLHFDTYDRAMAGDGPVYKDFAIGDRIDHVDGMTVEEAEHQLATRLYQNTARVHFNQFTEGQGRFGRRLIYGGHVISLARALSFNGLCHAADILAINGGTHAAPLFAGDTVFAWSEVLDKYDPHGRSDAGAVRLRMVASKDRPCSDFPLYEPDGRGPDGKYAESVILDFDFWALVPNP